MAKINTRVLVSSPQFFSDDAAINSYMDSSVPINRAAAMSEHTSILEAFRTAGIKVQQVLAPEDCQDGVYTANWALIKDNMAVMSRLPGPRKAEEDYARAVLADRGYITLTLPESSHFSGQGDALICGDYLLIGSCYRTSKSAQDYLAKIFPSLKMVRLQTLPELDDQGSPVTNASSGWPDSFFYDLDLALAVIDERLIAWCPEAFDDDSRTKIQEINDIEKIEVSLAEAKEGFACNLVSTGEYVIMSDRAPMLKAELVRRGLKVITPSITELAKGGGFIRCISLSL